MNKKVEKTVSINKAPFQVWEYLTNPILMKKWMREPEMNVEVMTDWKVGNPVLIKGFHNGCWKYKSKIFQPGQSINI